MFTYRFKRLAKKLTDLDFAILKDVILKGWGAKDSGPFLEVNRQSSAVTVLCLASGKSVTVKLIATLTLPVQPKPALAQELERGFAQALVTGVHEALLFVHQGVWRLIADLQRDAFIGRVKKNTPKLYDDKALEDFGRFNKGTTPKLLKNQDKASDGYNLWSGNNEKVVKKLPGFIMGETNEHLKALRQLYNEYHDDPYNMPRDPDYQVELVKWLESQPRDSITGRLKWPTEQEIKKKATELKKKYAKNLTNRKVDSNNSDFALVGYHTAHFRGAWEPTSDEVAKMAGKAMIPVSSTGLDKHGNPTNTVQFLREIPMVIRYAKKTTDKLLIEVKACEEYALSLTKSQTLTKSEQSTLQSTQSKMLAEVKNMRDGIQLYLDGTQRLALDVKKVKERGESSVMMRKGRDAYLQARAAFDKLRP